MTTTKDRLKHLIYAWQEYENDGVRESTDKLYGFRQIPLNHTFNKEVGDNLIGIRSDGDFYIEARLPLEYNELSVKEIVDVLWPWIDDATFEEDLDE